MFKLTDRDKGSVRERVLASLAAIALVLLALVSFLILVPACGIYSSWLPTWTNACPRAGVLDDGLVEQAALDREQASLKTQITALEREIARLRCEQVAEAPPPPKSEPESVPEPKAAQCKPAQTIAKTSEIVFVFDTSSSMELSVDLPRDLDNRMDQAWKEREQIQARIQGGSFLDIPRLVIATGKLDRLHKEGARYPGERRISVAKKVTIDAILKAPADVNIGLVSFNACETVSHGRFTPPQRGALIQRVNGLKEKDATPLAIAVEAAAASLDGGDTADDFVNIVVITDGRDSCKGDPCSAARRAKRAKPGLSINVIDLSNVGQARCMAEETGGFYKQRGEGMDIGELSRSVREAAGYEGDGLCRQ